MNGLAKVIEFIVIALGETPVNGNDPLPSGLQFDNVYPPASNLKKEVNFCGTPDDVIKQMKEMKPIQKNMLLTSRVLWKSNEKVPLCKFVHLSASLFHSFVRF